MADLALKEGQLYLLDGSVLVEATFNDTTGMWQLHEPEERGSWLVSPNGRLIGMQFDMARDVWLLEREPDVWGVTDLLTANKNTPKLGNLLRQAESIAEQKHGGQLTIMRVNTGWKAMFGAPNPETEAGKQQIEKLRTFKTLYEALSAIVP
jgi:hypothetical protein